MKELTKQWHWLYTRKFKITFEDFIDEISPRKDLLLTLEKRRSAIFFAQIKNTEIWDGVGLINLDCYLTDLYGTTLPLDKIDHFAVYDLLQTIADTSGFQGAVPAREDTDKPTPDNIMLHYANNAEIYVILKANSNFDLSDLTSGQAYIWYSVLYQK